MEKPAQIVNALMVVSTDADLARHCEPLPNAASAMRVARLDAQEIFLISAKLMKPRSSPTTMRRLGLVTI